VIIVRVFEKADRKKAATSPAFGKFCVIQEVNNVITPGRRNIYERVVI